MSIEDFLLLAVGGFIVFMFARTDEINRHRDKRYDWNISTYSITLRYNHRSLLFDGEILGDSTTITVIDGEIHNVIGPHVEQSTIDDYDRFTVEGLFGQVMYYSSVQYDNVYGFPTRLGNKTHWVIEVFSFEMLS